MARYTAVLALLLHGHCVPHLHVLSAAPYRPESCKNRSNPFLTRMMVTSMQPKLALDITYILSYSIYKHVCFLLARLHIV